MYINVMYYYIDIYIALLSV